MRRWFLRLAVVAALALVAVVLRATVLAPAPVEVRVAEVGRGPVAATVTNSKAGTIEARRRAELSPEVAGIVVELPFREGARVRAGDLLLRLSDATARAEVELAERALEAAEALHERACIATERAGRELERKRRLVETNVISTDELDQVQSAYDLALASCKTTEAEREKARAALGLARAELAKTEVRAPFDGVVAELTTELGEWVTPSPPMMAIPAVVDLIDPTSMYVSAPMDEVDLARIQPGQLAQITIDPYPDRSFVGRVIRIAPYVLDIEKQNRTVEIEVELDDAVFAAGLLPGTSADVEVVLDERADVLRIPTAALIAGARVLVLEEGRLAERAVETGLRNWEWTEIVGGLAPGARVVVSLDRAEVRSGARAVASGAPRP